MTKLVKWEAARQALAEAQNIDEVKEIRDQAQAMKAYAKQIGETLEVQNNVAEIKLRAERKMGSMLAEQPKQHGARPSDAGLHDVTPLSELGITKMQSHRWQREAELPEDEFEEHIQAVKAENKELTSIGLFRKATKHIHNVLMDEPIQLPEGVFDVIYADPPWKYNNDNLEGSAEKHYITMSIEELISLRSKRVSIKDCFANNSVMFMWTTNPMLEDAIVLMNAWGFNYKTNFVWTKDRPCYGRLGFYNYGSHELLLLGTMGSFVPKDVTLPNSRIDEPKTKHSKKPDRVYEIIETLYPNGKYLELFHRGLKRDNWESWGERK